MPGNVTILREKIGGAFERSPSGIDKLVRLRKGEEVDYVLETRDALPVPARRNQNE
jgi:hypothetical protein